MITPLHPNGQALPVYDPLATSFMTGGMQYMPNAQFLTSADYGAFRTMPGPNMAPPVMQQPSLMQSYLTANRGNVLGMTGNYFINTYNPAVDQMRHQIMARRRMQDAGSVFGATGIDMLAAGGLALATGGFSGLLLGAAMPGIAASGVSDRVRQARAIQDMTMSKIVGGPGMSAGLGQGFNMSQAAQLDQGVRTMAAGDLSFKQEDYRKILSLGISTGMFDYSNNSQQYKTTLKTLRNNFKTMMELFETADFGELSQNMQRMQRMGVSASRMQGIAGREAMFARMTGISHGDMVDTYGQQGAMIYSRYGMTNYQGSLENMANAARVTMMQRMGLINEAQVARAGGVSGMAQTLTEQGARVHSRLQDFIMPGIANGDFTGLDSQKVMALMSGKMSFDEAMRATSSRRWGAKEMAAYQANRPELDRALRDKLGPAGMEMMHYQVALQLGQREGYEGRDALNVGYQLLGYSAEQAGQIAARMSDKDYLRGMQQQMQVQQNKEMRNAREERDRDRGLPRRIALAGRKSWAAMSEATYGRWMYNRAYESDYDEAVEAGVYAMDTYGISDIGLAGISDDEIARRRKGSSVAGLSGAPESFSARAKRTGSGSASAAKKDDQLKWLNVARDHVAVTKELADAAKTSGSAMGLDFIALQRVSGKLKKAGHFRSAHIRQAFMHELRRLHPGKSKAEIERMADQAMADQNLTNYVIADAVGSNEQLSNDVGDLRADLQGELSRMSADELKEKSKELSDEIGELTDQGFLGGDNKSDTSALKDALGESGRSAQAYSLITMLETLKTDRGSDPAHVAGVRERMIADARALGLSAEEISSLLGGDTTALQAKLQEYGLSEKGFRRVGQAARRKAKGDIMDLRTIDEMRARVDRVTTDAIGMGALKEERARLQGGREEYKHTESNGRTGSWDPEQRAVFTTLNEVLQALLATMQESNRQLSAL